MSTAERATLPAGSAIEGPEHPRRLRPPTPRVALVIGAAILLAVVLYLARGALSPFVVGLALVYVLDPAVERLARVRIGARRLPRTVAVLLIYIAVVVVLGWTMSLLLGPLVSQIGSFADDLPAFLSAAETWYRSLELPGFLRSAIDGFLDDAGEAASGLDFGALVPFARSVAGFVASFFGYLIIPIWAFYLLKDRPSLRDGIYRAIPASWRRDVWASLGIVNRVFGQWLRAQLFLGVVVGIATFVGLEALGFVIDSRFRDFAILLAVIAGIFELLPIIGPILSMVPTLVIALTMDDPVRAVIAVLILYIAVQQLENNILVPVIQGDAIDLHPSVVILALIVGGSIAGLLGAIFALPVTAAARDLYRYAFRRLSEDDPRIPPPDDPDFLPFRDRLPDAEGRLPADRAPLLPDEEGPVGEDAERDGGGDRSPGTEDRGT